MLSREETGGGPDDGDKMGKNMVEKEKGIYCLLLDPSSLLTGRALRSVSLLTSKSQ